jgi:hypothetical protein
LNLQVGCSKRPGAGQVLDLSGPGYVRSDSEFLRQSFVLFPLGSVTAEHELKIVAHTQGSLCGSQRQVDSFFGDEPTNL